MGFSKKIKDGIQEFKDAYKEGYEGTEGAKKDEPKYQSEEKTNAKNTGKNENINKIEDEAVNKMVKFNQSIRGIFFNLLFTFICLLVGIFVFSYFSAKGNTGPMLLGIPISILPVVISYFRNGSISGVITDSFNVYYKDSQGRRQRDSATGFMGMILGFLVLMIAGIFITIIKIIVCLFKWLIIAIQSKGRAFISPYNVPILCVLALIGLLFVLNLAQPGTVSIGF